MRSQTPLVTVGLAVFNGEKYLKEAINSILTQTYTNFELIISDNASTDHTEEICRRYAAQDPRIRYFRNSTNIGGANNENLTFRLSKGSYFRWAAHDDVCAPDLLAKCVEVLERDPTIVLCYSQIVTIDEYGKPTGLTSRNNAAAAKSYERFAAIASSRDFCEETYGLIRADILQKTGLQKNYTASDRTLLCELSLHGRFYEIPEPLFYKRFHPGNVYIDWRSRMAWFGSKFEGKIVFPFWIQFFDYLTTIYKGPITAYEKWLCYLFMGQWLLFYGKKMVKDVLVALYMLLHSPEWRKQRYADTRNWA